LLDDATPAAHGGCVAGAQRIRSSRPCNHAGAPPDNNTFFCDYQRVKCYSHNFRQAGYQGAADACTEAQGELLHISSAAEQQLVEQVRWARGFCRPSGRHG
jgi:hypothetical protein